MRGAIPDEQSLFHAARRIGSPEARRRMLATACGGDTGLLARLEALLRVHDEDADFLKGSTTGLGVDAFGPPVPPPEPPGTVVGPYTLLGRLGEGGMGVVYLAEQTQPVRRQVALKLLRPGTAGPAALARFEGERQALALMDHPNIAKVFDGGAMPAGRAYFVMELVRGVPLTDFCDADRLGVRDRLGLFVQVCRGVQHAHQKGIAHRDLKPSNVLVPRYDGEPVPKIIDFGLAKATGGAAVAPHVTLAGQVVGTPEYMSPEQAAPDRGDIDTRTDVYALGVILYELLTGTTPLTRERLLTAGYADVLRRIRDEEPPRPSARLEQGDSTAVAAARGTDPGGLAGQVRGDLDWIALKCLEKDRDRRYESADGLARDVERFLRHEPVEASPPSVRYRLRKLARRHRAALATAAGFGLLLVGGAAVSTWQAVRATRAERTAVAERDRAEEARRQARRALDTLTDEAVERLLARQPKVTAGDREFLRRVLVLHEEFAGADADTPAARAGVAAARYRVGLIRSRLGEHAEAEAAFREAIDTQRALADEFPAAPDHRRDLARTHLRLGGLLRETGRPGPAEAACVTAVGLWRALADESPARPDYRRELAGGHSSLAVVLIATNRPKEAEAALRAAVDLLRALPAEPDDRRLLAGAHHNLGNVLFQTDRFGPAEESYVAARDLRRKLAADFPDRPDDRSALAQQVAAFGPLYALTNRRPQAEEAFRDAAGQLRALVNEYPTRPDYRRLLASSHSNLGNLLTRMKRHAAAEEAYRAALAANERLAADHPLVSEHRIDLARTLGGLAFLKSVGGDHPAAIRLLEQALVHGRAALQSEPSNPTYRELHRTQRAILAEAFGSLGDHAKAADAADELARFAFDPAGDAYTAAWVIARCLTLAQEDGRLTGAERGELLSSYADRAVTHLRAAVRHGFKDGRRLRTAVAFRPFHSRSDFQKLLQDLDATPQRP